MGEEDDDFVIAVQPLSIILGILLELMFRLELKNSHAKLLGL